MNCYLCGSEKHTQIADRVRDRDDVSVLRCDDCGLVFLSSFDHITKDFYEESKIHKGKTSLDLADWIKTSQADDERRFKTFKSFIKGKSLLDFGAGNCNFLFKVDKLAGRTVGIEPEARIRTQLSKSLERDSIEIYENISELNSARFDIITMFHVIEHLPNPVSIIKQLKSLLTKNGRIIIETPNSNDALISLYKCKAFMDSTFWSCHLFLYNDMTLGEVCKQSGLSHHNIGQVQRYPLTNHLYWLARGKSNGQEQWSFLHSDELNDLYIKQLKSLNSCDTLLGVFFNGN